MCLMTQIQTPYTDGEIRQANKSSVTDQLFPDIGGYTDQQNETTALHDEWNLTEFVKPRFSNELLEGYYENLTREEIERKLRDLQDGEIRQANKSSVTDQLFPDIGGYTDQQNETTALQDEWIHYELFGAYYQNLTREEKERILRDLQDENLTAKKISERIFKDLQVEIDLLSVEWNDENLTRKEKERILRDLQDENLTAKKITERIFKDLQVEIDLLSVIWNDENLTREETERILRDLQDAIDRETIKRIREVLEKEKREYIRQLFLMVLLFIILKNISGSIKCRQTSCRKYPFLNSILYLLWQSGDIEVNPGPANSTTYRNWLYEICSIVRKAIAGVPAECKMCNIWKKKPENWPHGELYFDPRNSKGLTVNKVEDFLQILIRCCDGSSKLSHEITSEIDTWNKNRSKDNEQLLHLYRTRECLKSTDQVDRSLKVLQRHLLPDENLAVEVNPCIRISLSCQPAIHQQFITHKIYRAEATRKIASYLCIILHGKDPEGKCDNIWTKTPDGWPTDCRYYNPNNGGKRCAKNEDAMLVEVLITLCKQKSIILPRTYQDMVEVWRADDQTLLSKLLTRHTAETDLKKAVMKLHEEGLLQDPEVDKHLREIGLLVQCDGSTHNVKSQKRKIVNTTNKHETKRTRQSDHEDAMDTILKELLPDCYIEQLLDNQSDSFLLDTIGQNIPDFLGDEADDIQFH